MNNAKIYNFSKLLCGRHVDEVCIIADTREDADRYLKEYVGGDEFDEWEFDGTYNFNYRGVL